MTIALFHFHVTQIKRSTGQSAVAAAAYRSGEKLHSEYYGEDSDYTRNFIPGFFSWSNTILLGSLLKATPNGRKRGEPINHGANPNGGFRKDGAVTAMCNSIAVIQPGYGNTAPVQLEVDPGIANDAEGVGKMCAMIRGILDSGNTLLNINIIDAKKILEAQGSHA